MYIFNSGCQQGDLKVIREIFCDNLKTEGESLRIDIFWYHYFLFLFFSVGDNVEMFQIDDEVTGIFILLLHSDNEIQSTNQYPIMINTAIVILYDDYFL